MKLSQYREEYVVYTVWSALHRIRYDIAEQVEDDLYDKIGDIAHDFFVRTVKILTFLKIECADLDGISPDNAARYLDAVDLVERRLRQKYRSIVTAIERNEPLPVSFAEIDIDLTGELGESTVPLEDLE